MPLLYQLLFLTDMVTIVSGPRANTCPRYASPSPLLESTEPIINFLELPSFSVYFYFAYAYRSNSRCVRSHFTASFPVAELYHDPVGASLQFKMAMCFKLSSHEPAVIFSFTFLMIHRYENSFWAT